MQAENPQIRDLRKRYKGGLSDKANTVNEYSQTLTESGLSFVDWADQVRGDLHKMVGSSGMYGYEDVAELARDIMHNLDKQDVAELEQQLLALRDLLQQYANS